MAGLPKGPGVYLLKDAKGVVSYIGKANNLRARVASYFQKGADLENSRGPAIVNMIRQVAEIDFLQTESEVEALLIENRLIKDTQPRYNVRLVDGKTFPYIEITTKEDFPRVRITRQPEAKGVTLYGPFTAGAELRAALVILQKVFKFRTCSLNIREDDQKRRSFRPCLLYSIKQCTGPCAAKVSKKSYRLQIDRLRQFISSKRSVVLRQLNKEMEAAAAKMDYEEAGRLRDEIRALESLAKRGRIRDELQPESFYQDPAGGLEELGKVLGLRTVPRVMEGVDVADISGQESCGSLVRFIDGKPFKAGYRRFKIKTVQGADDYASIAEILSRRYRLAGEEHELYPDVILIDGGLGQLRAGLAALDKVGKKAPMVISLAKREEEIYVQGKSKPIRLGRNSAALKLCQRIRDEAHRFAQQYHHILRKKKTFE
ncbi:MAG: GIY-YIG nuclease family protein [Actinobacteria bacterium]|nr:GIY-YIG nuclease family protein [Actinomycetota bacterium]